MCFFFNDTATTEIYTLSLHDALPISARRDAWSRGQPEGRVHPPSDQGQLPRGPVGAGVLHLHARHPQGSGRDRKSTRLNSSHANISYAVFCLKKKKEIIHKSVNNQK